MICRKIITCFLSVLSTDRANLPKIQGRLVINANVCNGSIADLHPMASLMSAFGGKADVKNRQNPPMLTSALCQERTLAIKTCQRPAIRDNVVTNKKLKNVNGQNITQKAKRLSAAKQLPPAGCSG